MNDRTDGFLERLFARCEAAGASDIHLAPGLPPYLRVHGELSPAEGEGAVEASALEEAARALARRTGREADGG